jgi:hypothetical protein
MPLCRHLQLRRRAYTLLRRIGVSDRTLYHRLGFHPIRMNHVPRRTTERLLTAAGMTVIDVLPGWLGHTTDTDDITTLTYLATRSH